MEIIKNHLFAIKYVLLLLFKGKFIKYLIPGIVFTILFYLMKLGMSFTQDNFLITDKIPWIGKYIDTLTHLTFKGLHSFSIFIYQFTILTLFSPFNTMLSQRLEEHTTGNQFKTTAIKFIRDFIRLAGIIIVGSLLYVFIYSIWMLLAKVLELQFLSPYISAVLIAFFTGFNSYDYSLERHDIGVIKSWRFAFNHPLDMILTGSIFTILLFIPIVGIIIAPTILTMVGTINYLVINKKTIQKAD